MDDYPITKTDILFTGLVILGAILKVFGLNILGREMGNLSIYIGLGGLVVYRLALRLKSKK